MRAGYQRGCRAQTWVTVGALHLHFVPEMVAQWDGLVTLAKNAQRSKIFCALLSHKTLQVGDGPHDVQQQDSWSQQGGGRIGSLLSDLGCQTTITHS